MPKKPKWNEQPCPQCKEPVSVEATRCPHCTTAFSEGIIKSRRETHDFSQKFGLGCVGLLAVLIMIYFAFSGWRNSNPSLGSTQEIAKMEVDPDLLPPSTEGIAFDVPSHPTGRYRLLRWKQMSNGHIEALTRQDSVSGGTNFSVKEIDCKNRDIWFLGQGDSEEKALSQKRRDGLNYLVEGSIQDVTISVVCREAKK